MNIIWSEHNSFKREFKKCGKTYRDLEPKLKNAKKLLEIQFDPINPENRIDPGKIHRRKSSDDNVWEIWKLEMVVDNFRPSQFPRMWFGVRGNSITLLAVHSHIDNYKDNDAERDALDRYIDF